ncbi:DUF2189 domain-containing protein [Novispirillum itersonii subsp. nipponicum]
MLPYGDRVMLISTADVWGWLRLGWRDYLRHPGRSTAYGAVFVAIGYGLAFGLKALGMLYLITPMIAGFLLVAPLLALGFYALSRDAEQGRPPSLWRALNAWQANSFHVITAGLLLMLFMMIWVRIAALIFALFFPYTSLTWHATLEALLTPDGLLFLAVGTGVGGVMAVIGFTFSAFSLPLLLDRKVDAFAAGYLSGLAVLANPGPMLLWAAIITALTVLGLLTGFLGLMVTLPLLGHATWYAYRRILRWD